jgi:hypothetical protein
LNNWQNLCSLIAALIHGGGVSEATYHSSFITWLNLVFHWDKDKINDKVSVQMGSTKEADIVLEGNDFNIVIEMKQHSVDLGNKEAGQLISYMRILGAKYKYGLLIGNKLKLFYDYDPNKEPLEIKEIVSLDFDPKNKDGIELGTLLDYTVCSNDKLKEYSKGKMEYSRRIQITENLRRDLEANNSEKVKQILKNELSSEYDDEVIKSILDDIIISFREKQNKPSIQSNSKQQPINNSFLDEVMEYYNSICDKNFMCYGSNRKYRQIRIIKAVRLLHYEFIIRRDNFIEVEIHYESTELEGLKDLVSSFTGNIKGYEIGYRKGRRSRVYIEISVPYSAGKEVCSAVMKELISQTSEKISDEYKKLNL